MSIPKLLDSSYTEKTRTFYCSYKYAFDQCNLSSSLSAETLCNWCVLCVSLILMDCTGEGVLFVEVDTDISLEDLGDLSPPIPRAFDFINNVPGSDTITGSPILLFQVGSRGFMFA